MALNLSELLNAGILVFDNFFVNRATDYKDNDSLEALT